MTNQAPSWKANRLQTLEAQARARRENKLRSFAPYERQAMFFEAGAQKRERLFLAGNQCGKSTAGAFEMALHLTGQYPSWWKGKRFDHAIKAWCGGEGGLQVRDINQDQLCGLPGSEEHFGTGFIPKSCLLGKAAGHGVTDLYDHIRVRHVSGGVSILHFKTYEQGRSKWQGATLDVIWVDEEPPADIYSEALARLTGSGIIFGTLTPLLGYTPFVNRFLRDDSIGARNDRYVVKMGLRHAEHFSDEEKERRLAGYPAHERAARENGDPMLGSGGVFEEVIESDISTKLALTDVPAHFACIWGIDFGISHPFAAALCAWDRDSDVFYVIATVKLSGGIPAVHVDAMRRVAPHVALSIPVAWPHDGTAREKGSGQPLAAIYKDAGLKMLPQHATLPSGGYSTEAGVMEMLTRMRSGRFKVASHLADWFDEMRQYHRKDGQIVKVADDLLSATRTALIARRFARPVERWPGQFSGARQRQSIRPPDFDVDRWDGRSSAGFDWDMWQR